LLKVPTIYTTPKVVGYLPDGAVQLGAFLFSGAIIVFVSHDFFPSIFIAEPAMQKSSGLK
jgi:hypothetical protein